MWKHGLVETDLRRTREINQLNEMRRERVYPSNTLTQPEIWVVSELQYEYVRD